MKNVNDASLSDLRQDPRPEFTQKLWDRLQKIDAEGEVRRAWWRGGPLLTGVILLALIASMATLPAARAAARGLLDLFRVKRLAAGPLGSQPNVPLPGRQV